jgi:ATP-dependent RNA helicase RhlE
MDFDALGLHPLVRRGIAALGFARPTPIQAAMVPPAIAGRDVIGLAPTGTGKTLAFAMPLAHRLLSDPPPLIPGPRKRGGRTGDARVDPRTRLRALVLCPTRELAQQVAKDVQTLVKGSVLRVGAVWGKSPLGPQREMIERGVDLVAGTPGRVRELLDLDAISLAWVRQVVVDEADRMLDLGFLPQVEGILGRMPPERQMLFLSATFPPAVDELCGRFLREPERIEAGGHGRPAEHVGQTVHEIDDAFKTALVLAIVRGGRRQGVLVFTRTRRRAGWVAAALRRHGITTGLLHGDRSQPQREAALAEFAAGRSTVLVATDVAARGLHVPAVRTVVNYDLPLLPEEYVHRIGRAGHGGGFAESFTFVDPTPEERSRWKRLSAIAELELPITPTPDISEWMRPEDRVRFAKTIEIEARKLRIAEDERVRRSTARAVEEARRPGAAGSAKGTKAEAPKKKTTKRAGKKPGPFRGSSRSTKVDRSEKPGGGVRKPSTTSTRKA